MDERGKMETQEDDIWTSRQASNSSKMQYCGSGKHLENDELRDWTKMENSICILMTTAMDVLAELLDSQNLGDITGYET